MLEDLTLFAMARRSMSWINQRQQLLAQNVANVDTPNYQSKDLAPLDFKGLLEPQKHGVTAVVDQPDQISPSTDDDQDSQFKVETERKPEESKLDGNSVLLEEQMEKVGEGKSNYQLASNLMQANMAMLKSALGSGGTTA